MLHDAPVKYNDNTCPNPPWLLITSHELLLVGSCSGRLMAGAPCLEGTRGPAPASTGEPNHAVLGAMQTPLDACLLPLTTCIADAELLTSDSSQNTTPQPESNRPSQTVTKLEDRNDVSKVHNQR